MKTGHDDPVGSPPTPTATPTGPRDVDDPASGASGRAGSWLPGALVMVGFGIALFPSAGRDDAYITFWPAHTLATTGEMVNYGGERLEQSSSLLHVLLLAVAHLVLPLSMPTIGWLVGLLAGVGAVVLAAVGAERVVPGTAPLAGVLTATSAYLLYWTTGGLETSLAALAVTATVVTLASVWSDRSGRAWLGFVAAATALVLVRPEGALVLGALLVGCAVLVPLAHRSGLLALRPAPGPVLAGAGAVVAAAYGAVTLFRWSYFGALVPQPVSSKVGGLRIEEGLRYARIWLVQRPAVGVAILIGGVAAVALARRSPRPEPALASLTVLALLGATVTSGGDWMEAGRMFAPVAPLVSLLAAAGIHRAFSGRALSLVAALVVAVNIAGVAHVARQDSTTGPVWSSVRGELAGSADGLGFVEARNRVHVRDAAFVPVLADAVRQVSTQVREPVRISSGQAGMVPYYVVGGADVAIEFIDIGSLASDHFDECGHLLHRSALGNAIRFGDWFSHPDRCGVPLPHLVYGVRRAGAVETGPYVEVFRQDSVLTNDSALLPGAPVGATLYLAVRADLAGPWTTGPVE